MINFDFLNKGVGIVSPPHFVYGFQRKRSSYYILVTDQISLRDCLYLSRYLEICVLQLIVIQVMTSWILKLSLFF